MSTPAAQWQFIETVAAEMGAKEEARRKWRERGRVPHRWRLPIMEAARAKRVKLDSAIFDNVPQPDDEASEETQPVDSHREGQRRSAALALNPETRRSARQ